MADIVTLAFVPDPGADYYLIWSVQVPCTRLGDDDAVQSES